MSADGAPDALDLAGKRANSSAGSEGKDVAKSPTKRAKTADPVPSSTPPPASAGSGAFASPASGAVTVKNKKKMQSPAKPKGGAAAAKSTGAAANSKENKGGANKGAGGAGSAKKASSASAGVSPALSTLRQEILDMGGADIVALGWTMGQDAPPAESNTKVGRGKGAMRFMSPQGKLMGKAQVISNLGLGGMTREQCFKKAQQYRMSHPVPFTCGNIAVKHLGNIMVERGPGEPLFHRSDCFFPIDYKAVWTDPNTGIEYTSEILDGMDVLEKDTMAFQVTWGLNKVIKEVVEEAWQAVKQHQMEHGSDVEKAVAKAWPTKNLGLRSGLWEKEVRMRLEGMRGAIDCFKYKFISERASPAAKAAAAADAGSASAAPAKAKKEPKADGAGEAVRGKKGPKKAAAAAPTAAVTDEAKAGTGPTGPKPKRPQGKSAFQVFSHEHRKSVGEQNPELNFGDLSKMMNQLWRELPDDEKAKYEAQSTRKTMPTGADVNEGGEAGDDEPVKQEEDDLTKWLTEGNEHIGKRVRRYVYDWRGAKSDAKHGVVTHWLPVELADYVSEDTGLPSALWKVTFDDERVGSEDLEEDEVIEAHNLMDEELPEKIKEKMAKSEASLELYRAKKREKEELRLAKEKAREEDKEKKRLEKEARELERKQQRAEIQQLKQEAKELAAAKGEEAKQPQLDESVRPCLGGVHKGKVAGMVAKPPGTDASFPPASAVQDFLPVFMFLRDLSNPLGAVRMSYDEIKNCLVSTSQEGTEGFCEVAKWLTDMAVRSKWINQQEPEDGDDKEIVDKEANMEVMDLALAPGPLLNSKAKEVNSKDVVSYSCWQLVNESSWPELARQMMATSAIGDEYKSLCDHLGEVEVGELSSTERMMLLRFLCDEACSSDKVQRVINVKLKQVERILERKRVEDAAIRKREQTKKQLARIEGAKEGEAKEEKEGGAKEGEEGEKTEEGEEKKASKVGTAMTGVQVMTHLAKLEPETPFTVKYQEKNIEGVLEVLDDKQVAVTSAGKRYESPAEWVKAVQKKEKAAAIKAIIKWKGKTLKQLEEELGLKPERVEKEKPDSDKLNLDLVMMEGLADVDVEKRSAQIKAVLRQASRGLRHEPIGQDRWRRSYYCFDGVFDQVWAVDPLPLDSMPRADVGSDYGFDGVVTSEYREMNVENSAPKWTCYSADDGTLHELCELLVTGPMGERESGLIEALKDNGITKGFEKKQDGEPAGESTDVGDGKDEGGDGEGNKEEEYEWLELPHIGDVVWAKDSKGVKVPVVLVEPPGEVEGTSRRRSGGNDDAMSEDEVDEDFVTSGSQYLGKRVRLRVEGRKDMQEGVVKWFLPEEVSDYISETTGKLAALWRVKFDDRELTNADVEEFEVREAMLEWARAEAKRQSAVSDVLTSKSMFGQEIQWVYGQSFAEKQTVERYPLKGVEPYLQYRDIRMQDMRRANKQAVLRMVNEANYYLEEKSSATDQEQNLKYVLSELRWQGAGESQLDDSVKSACHHCMRYPRVLNVVQDSRESIPLTTTPKELTDQLRALFRKLPVDYITDEEVQRKIRGWYRDLDEVSKLDDVIASLKVLERILNDKADEASIEAEESLPIDLDDWNTEGHEFIGKRLSREFKGRFGHIEGYLNGRVVGWLPREESDYKDSEGNPQPLWHIVRDDGEEEDLEEFEVLSGMKLLIKRGDHPDHSKHSGIWPIPRDRERFKKMMSGAKTSGAAALALYLIGDAALYFTSKLTLQTRIEQGEWDDHCFVCSEGGNLMCCDLCPRTVHPNCIGLSKAPRGDYLCHYCEIVKRKAEEREEKGAAANKGAASRKPVTKRDRDRDGDDGGDGGGGKRAARGGQGSKKPSAFTRPATESEKETMRRAIARSGALNGSVAEVQPDAKAERRDERWFVLVVDGDVINKRENPQLKGVIFFTDWRPKKNGERIRVPADGEVRPVDVASINSIGAIHELLEGNEKRGYTPVDV